MRFISKQTKMTEKSTSIKSTWAVCTLDEDGFSIVVNEDKQLLIFTNKSQADVEARKVRSLFNRRIYVVEVDVTYRHSGVWDDVF